MSPELREYLHRYWFGVDSIQKLTPLLGRTVLHDATEQSVELVRELMCEMGDLVHHRDNYGATALHYACAVGNQSVVALLSDHLDQNVQDDMGCTALHGACTFNPQFVPLLKWTEAENSLHETPIDLIPDSHIHVLAKLRRLFGTLPAAYIRLVHAYT